MLKLILFIFVPLTLTWSQSNTYHFLLVQKDGIRVEGNSGHFEGSDFKGINVNGDSISINENQIDKLYRRSGSKVFKMGALGFLVGVVFGLSITTRQDFRSSNQDPAPIIFGSAAVGGIIGALIGGFSYNWEKVHLPKQKDIK